MLGADVNVFESTLGELRDELKRVRADSDAMVARLQHAEAPANALRDISVINL